MVDLIDREPAKSKLVRAYRRNQDLTLMEVRRAFYGVVTIRMGVLAITEGRDGVMTARIESLEQTGIDHA